MGFRGPRLSQSQDQLSARPPGGARGATKTFPQTPGIALVRGGHRSVPLALPRSGESAHTQGVGYPASVRIDEIIAAKAPTFSVEFFPPKTDGGDRGAVRDGALAARARARLRLGHLRRRRLDPGRHGRDHPGAEGRARLRDDGPPELRRRDDRGAGGDAGPDRRGGDRERLRPARRPAAGRRGLRPARGRPGQRRRAEPPSSPRAGTSRSAAPASPRCTPRRPTWRPTSPT